jgi:hypothetical protein
MGGGIELFKRSFGLKEYTFFVDRHARGTDIDFKNGVVKLGSFVTTGRMLELCEEINRHEHPEPVDLPVLTATIP